MPEGFPWKSHRSLAEVAETDALRERAGALRIDERRRLEELIEKELRANRSRADQRG
jgi:hypothetical protein